MNSKEDRTWNTKCMSHSWKSTTNKPTIYWTKNMLRSPLKTGTKFILIFFLKLVPKKHNIFRLSFLKMIMETLISKTFQSTIVQMSKRVLIFWWWATLSVKSVRLPWINVPLARIACSLLPLRASKKIQRSDFARNCIWLTWRGRKEFRKPRLREVHWMRLNTSIYHWPI